MSYHLLLALIFSLISYQSKTLANSSPKADPKEKYRIKMIDVINDKDIHKKSVVLYHSYYNFIIPIFTIYGNKFLPEDYDGPIFDEIHFVPEFPSYYDETVKVDKTKFYNGCYRMFKSKHSYSASFMSSQKLNLKDLNNDQVKKLNLPYLNQNICHLEIEEWDDGPDYIVCRSEDDKVFQTEINGITLYFVLRKSQNRLLIYEPFVNGKGFAELLNFSLSDKKYKVLEKPPKETKGDELKECVSFAN